MSDDIERGNRGRFLPGSSGNPRGRPKKSRTVHAAILKAAHATVTATENGRRRKIPKIDAAATQLANKGASGDLRAGKMLLDLAARAEVEQQSSAPPEPPLSLSDQQIVDDFLNEFRRQIEEDRA